MSDIIEAMTKRQAGTLPDHLGVKVLEVEHGRVRLSFDVGKHHMAPNGFMHAGAVVTLADTACGYGCVNSLPDGAQGFTTIELKSNFLGTAREGTVVAEGKLLHGGRTTQVWDAVVTHQDTGKTIALFRCTQMILYPR